MKTTILGLATFLLVSLFFVNATTSISNRAVGEYDPWADLDGDGDIDIFDIVDIAGKYATTGDPARNVTVTNFPTELEPKTIVLVQNLTLTTSDDGKIFALANVAGYNYVSVFVAYYRPFNNAPSVRFYHSCMNITSHSYFGSIETSQMTTTWEHRSLLCFAVGAPNLAFKVIISNDSIELTIVLYCYN